MITVLATADGPFLGRAIVASTSMDVGINIRGDKTNNSPFLGRAGSFTPSISRGYRGNNSSGGG